jgi:putative salt-induced outer membrane protein YdiY
MHNPPFRTSAFVLLLGIPLAGLEADVLHLRNGDRISGTVTGITDSAIRVTTEYAGDIEVGREAVFALETDGNFTVQREDGTPVEGQLTLEGGVPGVLTTAGFVPAPMTGLVVTVEPEPVAEEGKPKKWSGFVESGLTIRSGNTDTTDFTFKSSAERAGDWTKLTLTLSADYGEAESIINTRRYKSEGKWKGYLTDRFYLLGLTSAEQDDGRKLDLRLAAGAGAGYTFIENESRHLSLEAGVEHTWERWNPFTPQERTDTRNRIRTGAFERLAALTGQIDGEGSFGFGDWNELRLILLDIRDPLRDYETRENDFVSARITGEFTQRLFKESTLSEKAVLLPNLEDFGEYRFTNELALMTPLTKALDLRVSLESEYDSLAEESDVDAWNHMLKTGLRYKF